MSIIEDLEAQARELERNAEASEVVAAHFRPAFEACWQPPLGNDKVPSTMVDQTTALELRPFVLDNETQAKRWRKLARQLRDAVELIEGATP